MSNMEFTPEEIAKLRVGHVLYSKGLVRYMPEETVVTTTVSPTSPQQ